MVRARLRRTLVDVVFAISTVPSIRASARVRIDPICARPAGVTGGPIRIWWWCALVDVGLADESGVAGGAGAQESVHLVHASSMLRARLPSTVVDVGLAGSSGEAGRARARVRVDSVDACTIPAVLSSAVINVIKQRF
jgi:hypothetical protein